MIFAAGLGTRLRPLTDTLPKALVPVAGKPLLQHIIGKLKHAGFNEIIINIHHFGQQIIDFVETNHYFDIRIEFSDERDQLLDTGGAIKKAAWFFDDGKPFLVHNVDILSNIDLAGLYQAHRKNNPLATLVCSERQTTRYLLFDNEDHLQGWINESTGEIKSPLPDLNSQQTRKLAFSGIHVLNPSIFSDMTDLPDRFPVIDFYLSLCHREKIACFIPPGLQLIDVGKMNSLDEAAVFLQQHPGSLCSQ